MTVPGFWVEDLGLENSGLCFKVVKLMCDTLNPTHETQSPEPKPTPHTFKPQIAFTP